MNNISNKDILNNKQLVVAFGNEKYIYKLPTYADFIRDYFQKQSGFPIEIAVKFISKQPITTPIPMLNILMI